MILEPWKSAEEIDRRLAAINDPELAELLRNANRELQGEPESYTSPSAPYWNKRIAFIALAGLFAMSAGYSASVATLRERPHTGLKPRAAAAIIPQRHRTPRATHRAAALPHPAARNAAPAVHRTAVAVAPAAPSEAQVRRARAQLLHEQALAAQAVAQARADAARAHHEAQLAMQKQAEANAQALHEALAAARAQARAEAIAQARAEALARADAIQIQQAERQALQIQQQILLQNATDPNTKPGYGVPPAGGRIDTIPAPNVPVPVPGPIDPNCTPHRGSLFNTALDHVRIGGTSVGAVLRLIHGP
jgi:hypothetical protein